MVAAIVWATAAVLIAVCVCGTRIYMAKLEANDNLEIYQVKREMKEMNEKLRTITNIVCNIREKVEK